MPLSRVQVVWRKALLGGVGILVCLYAITVLWYVQSMPDLGLRCAFDPSLKYVYEPYLRTDGGRLEAPAPRDVIIQVGDRPVETWPNVLQAFVGLAQETPVPVASLTEADQRHLTCVELNDEPLIR